MQDADHSSKWRYVVDLTITHSSFSASELNSRKKKKKLLDREAGITVPNLSKSTWIRLTLTCAALWLFRFKRMLSYTSYGLGFCFCLCTETTTVTRCFFVFVLNKKENESRTLENECFKLLKKSWCLTLSYRLLASGWRLDGWNRNSIIFRLLYYYEIAFSVHPRGGGCTGLLLLRTRQLATKTKRDRENSIDRSAAAPAGALFVRWFEVDEPIQHSTDDE